MSDRELLLKDYRLTTAEMAYHLPDFPKLSGFEYWVRSLAIIEKGHPDSLYITAFF